MQNRIMVNDSIKFREAAWELAKNGNVYVCRLSHSDDFIWWLVDADRANSITYPITLDNLFGQQYPPIRVEEFAQALVRAHSEGRPIPTLVVFNR